MKPALFKHGPRVLHVLALLTLSVISPASHAYQVGDSVDPQLLKALNIDNQKITLVDFFASWCTSCKKELPELDGLRDELAKRGVAIIGIDTDKELEKGKQFQQKLGLHFPVMDDTEQKVVSQFQPMGMPALFYLHQGKVVQLRLGAMPHLAEQIGRDLDALPHP